MLPKSHGVKWGHSQGLAPTQGEATPTQGPGPRGTPGHGAPRRPQNKQHEEPAGLLSMPRWVRWLGGHRMHPCSTATPSPAPSSWGLPLGSSSHGAGRCAGSEVDGALAGVAVILLDPRLDVRQLLLQVFAALLLLQEGRILPAGRCSARRNPAPAPGSHSALGTPPSIGEGGEAPWGGRGLTAPQPPNTGSRS